MKVSLDRFLFLKSLFRKVCLYFLPQEVIIWLIINEISIMEWSNYYENQNFGISLDRL